MSWWFSWWLDVFQPSVIALDMKKWHPVSRCKYACKDEKSAMHDNKILKSMFCARTRLDIQTRHILSLSIKAGSHEMSPDICQSSSYSHVCDVTAAKNEFWLGYNCCPTPMWIVFFYLGCLYLFRRQVLDLIQEVILNQPNWFGDVLNALHTEWEDSGKKIDTMANVSIFLW